MIKVNKNIGKAAFFGLAFMLVFISFSSLLIAENQTETENETSIVNNPKLPQVSERSSRAYLNFDLDKESSQKLINEKSIAAGDIPVLNETSESLDSIINFSSENEGIVHGLPQISSPSYSSENVEGSLRILPEDVSKIKVGITYAGSAQNPSGNIRIGGTGKYYIRSSAGKTIKTCSGGSISSVGKSGSQYYIYYNGRLIKKTGYYPIFKPASGTILSVFSYTGSGYNIKGDRKFRGNIIVRYTSYGDQYAPAALWVINHLGLEKYLRGIAEEPQNTATQGLKTTAIVARTYGLRNVKHPKEICARRGFHVFNDAKSQVYKGKNYEDRAPRLKQAVISTYGLVVTYKGSPIVAAYHSRCGGHTRSHSSYPYLKSKTCSPYRCSDGRYGHGWGMCMKGMRNKASHGWNYSQIIHHYYSSVSIKKIY